MNAATTPAQRLSNLAMDLGSLAAHTEMIRQAGLELDADTKRLLKKVQKEITETIKYL